MIPIKIFCRKYVIILSKMIRIMTKFAGFHSGQCLLWSQGASCQEFRDHQGKAQKLKEYQQEMQDFAAFLKSRFFGDDSPSANKVYTTGEIAKILGIEG